jgi:hypothetical protein
MFKNLNTVEKVSTVLINVLRLYMLTTLILFIYLGEYFHIFTIAISLIFSYSGLFVRKLFKIKLSLSFELFIILFLFISNFLGESHGLYFTLWWWDIMAHSISGLLLPFIGTLILLKINKLENSSPLLVGLFALFFTVFAAVMFEFAEFGSDMLYSTLHIMQDDGLAGTILDLFCDFVGGLISSVYIYYNLRCRKEGFIFKILILKTINKSKDLFKLRN